MTNKQQPGDRCQVATAHGTWLNATIISTRGGHGGALVRVDGWVTDVWAKPSEIRSGYTSFQLVEVQYTQGRWVEGNFSHWEDDTRERAYVATEQSGFGCDRFHYTNIRPALSVVLDPELRPANNLSFTVHPDPHSAAYQGEVGDHQPRVTETVAKYGHVAKDDEVREVSITITPEIPDLKFGWRDDTSWERLQSFVNAGAEAVDLGSAINQLGKVANTTREKIGYIEVAADFAMMGITPEQLRDYIPAFAHTIVTGATPEEVERFASQTLRDKYNRADEGLHHITREYRGAK